MSWNFKYASPFHLLCTQKCANCGRYIRRHGYMEPVIGEYRSVYVKCFQRKYFCDDLCAKNWYRRQKDCDCEMDQLNYYIKGKECD